MHHENLFRWFLVVPWGFDWVCLLIKLLHRDWLLGMECCLLRFRFCDFCYAWFLRNGVRHKLCNRVLRERLSGLLSLLRLLKGSIRCGKYVSTRTLGLNCCCCWFRVFFQNVHQGRLNLLLLTALALLERREERLVYRFNLGLRCEILMHKASFLNYWYKFI